MFYLFHYASQIFKNILCLKTVILSECVHSFTYKFGHVIRLIHGLKEEKILRSVRYNLYFLVANIKLSNKSICIKELKNHLKNKIVDNPPG